MAWSMTLRPEPATALLAAGVVASMIHFRERRTTAPLVLAAVLCPLALTAHHTGVVALAPVLAVAPSLIRWARTHVAEAATIVTASIGLLLALAFLGSDIEQRRADAALTRAYGLGADWRDEAARYFFLSLFPYGTTLRRASVALIVLATLAFVARSRRAGNGRLLTFPGVTLLAALGLLLLTPSKWPWHFGALLPIATIAVAAEAARIRDVAREADGWARWPFFAIGAACVAAAWSWSPRTPWSHVDLRTLEWILEFESWFPLSTLAIALPVFALVGALIRARRSGTPRLPVVPWRVASWVAPLVAVPLIAFTGAVLVADAAKTADWTLARQNLGALSGDQGCGLADDLTVPFLPSIQPRPPIAGSDSPAAPAWAPVPPVPGLPRFALTPDVDGSAETPWFELAPDGMTGLFVAGTPQPSDRLELEWGRVDGGRVAVLGESALNMDLLTEVGAGVIHWRFLAASELPVRFPKRRWHV